MKFGPRRHKWLNYIYNSSIRGSLYPSASPSAVQTINSRRSAETWYNVHCGPEQQSPVHKFINLCLYYLLVICTRYMKLIIGSGSGAMFNIQSAPVLCGQTKLNGVDRYSTLFMQISGGARQSQQWFMRPALIKMWKIDRWAATRPRFRQLICVILR